jgi:hypothetical protein
VDRYSDPYGYCVAHVCCYITGNPNGDDFPYAFFAQPDARVDDHSDADIYFSASASSNADTYSGADAGSHTYTNLASDAL